MGGTLGRDSADQEWQAVLRERVAGMEREIPMLRLDIERLRTDIYHQREHFDEKMEGQQRYIDRKMTEVAQVIRVTPATAVIDHKFWWLVLGIGVVAAVTLIGVITMMIRFYGNMPA